MTTYILMRNNKQSSPISLTELLKIGFKPYDLIWIEGKSAMWRYPSEVTELKEFAAAIEEQPYDRFYSKKKSDEKNNQHENDSKEKQVYVSLPDKINKEMAKTSATVQNKAVTEEYLPVSMPVAETKYSQPLNDIKEMYVANLRDKKRKTAEQLFFSMSIKRISFYLGLIAIGTVIGYFFFYSKNNPGTPIAHNEIKPKEAVIPVSNQSKLNPETIASTDEIKFKNDEPQQSFAKDAGITATEKKVNIEKKAPNETSTRLQMKEKGVPVNNPIKTEEVSPGVEINNATGERNKKRRNETEVNILSTSKPENELTRLVSVKSNNYQRGAFGGIRNLELTLTNQSKYLLDKVIVELEYIKPNEQPLRSEKILFKSIPPDGVLTIAIPPSNRGIKVAYKISSIESKEMTGDTAGL